jgi:hypothetical protein
MRTPLEAALLERRSYEPRFLAVDIEDDAGIIRMTRIGMTASHLHADLGAPGLILP